MSDDEHETDPSDDKRRVNGEVSLGTLTAGIARGLTGGELRDEAWWQAHDAQVRAERDAETAEIRRGEAKRRAQSLKSEGMFPAIAIDSALTTWPTQTDAMRRAQDFIASDKAVLVLAGGTGAGKTSAAAWVALASKSISPAFLRATELEARGRYDRDLRVWLRGRSMLVVDDLGAEVLDGHGVFRSLLDELVDLFYGDHKRLVITTNLRRTRERADEQDQFIERYGERVTSRLYEVGAWGDCGARDLRREARA